MPARPALSRAPDAGGAPPPTSSSVGAVVVDVLTSGEAPGHLLSEIRSLLDDAFGGEFSNDDWDHALGGWHVVLTDGEGRVLAHAAVVPRLLEVAGRPYRTGYVEGVATLPDRQGRGLGSVVMAEVSALVRTSFDVGALSTDRHGFYERLGWERWRGPTFARLDHQVVRSEDDDDGVMVLRFGASRDLDLEAAISCERRSGDDW